MRESRSSARRVPDIPFKYRVGLSCFFLLFAALQLWLDSFWRLGWASAFGVAGVLLTYHVREPGETIEEARRSLRTIASVVFATLVIVSGLRGHIPYAHEIGLL
jgi:hypothetical protein